MSVIGKAVFTRSKSELGAAPANESIQPFVITFVNGIYHSIQDWKNISADIQQLFGASVRPFYNPSSGWWVRDATRAGYNLALRPCDLELSRELAEHLRTALQEVEPNGRVLHIAHSGGAILTYLAARHHLSRSEKGRIDIITLGGGKSITRKYFPGRVCNYYSRNDPLAILDNRAAKLMRRTHNRTYAEIRDAKHNTTFVFLAAQANHPIVDHSMLGPTYRYALSLEAAAFKDRLAALLAYRVQQLLRERNRLRLLRKRAASLTGWHHFWDRQAYPATTNWIRRVRKFSAKTTGKRGYFSGKPPNPYVEAHPNHTLAAEEEEPPAKPLPLAQRAREWRSGLAAKMGGIAWLRSSW